jgi:catechol 2,3-dioxygenase-like lactoylglutathione lyase family enzyme
MIAVADVAVMVKDARASAAWWREKVGFDVQMIGAPDGHAVMVAPPGDRFFVHLCEGFAELEPGNTGIAFVTDDLAGTVRRMEGAGVRFTDRPAIRGTGGMAKFADPDGNVFWLIGAPTAFIRAQTRRKARGRAAARRRPGPRRPRVRGGKRSSLRGS